MILCDISQVEAGSMVGASILHPDRPEMELLAADTELKGPLIARLKKLGVREVWLRCDGTDDLDHAVSATLTLAQREVYERLKSDFSRAASRSVTVGDLQGYRQAVGGLIMEVMSCRSVAGLATRLSSQEAPLFTHSASVAYLAVLVGLELETYIVAQRPRLSGQNARDLTPLGLAGMLHDIGKTRGGESEREVHEVTLAGDSAPEGYRHHALVGASMLQDDRVPASTRQAVFAHHQRWDGQGWPTPKELRRPDEPPAAGRKLHVFARIVSAVNVVDNLLHDAEGSRRPAVAALADFASRRFDGWFDPVVRRGVLRQVPPFAVGALVTLSDGRQAVVIAPNRERPCRPAVRPLNANGVPDRGAEALSLDQHPALHIARVGVADVSGCQYELPDVSPADAAAMDDICELSQAEREQRERRCA